jgi:hypothetical protein
MDYNVFSLCTENYKDAFNFAIQSWLDNIDADITIYSDATWKSPSKRVKIEKVFSKSTDWGTNICRKPQASRMAMELGQNLAFIDMDCWVRSDLGHIFNQSFDMATTKMDRRGNICTGIYFYRNNAKMHKFLKLWEVNVKALKGFGSRKSKPKDQTTYSDTIYALQHDMEFINLDHSKYNRKISDTQRNPKQLKQLADDDSIVLHFYNKSYLSKRNVTEVFKTLRES